MARRLRIISAVILAILFSQWVYAAHVDKAGADANDSVCQICIHGHNLQGSMPVVDAQIGADTRTLPPPLPASERVADAAGIVPVARAPPYFRHRL